MVGHIVKTFHFFISPFRWFLQNRTLGGSQTFMTMTDLPLQNDELILELLNLILLQSDLHLPLLFLILQSGETMQHLSKVLLLVLPTLLEKNFPLLAMIDTFTQGNEILVNSLENQSDILPPFMDVPFQVVML